MTRLERQLRRIAAELAGLDAEWALVGALAVSVRTEPRFSRDVDLAVAVAGDAEAESLLARLRGRDYDIEALVEQEDTGRLATARLVDRREGADAALTDLLFASAGIEPEVVQAAERLEVLPGVIVPVARTGHLLALKLLSRRPERPQDEADIEALVRVATAAEADIALWACREIERRGFHRGRNLEAGLDSLLRGGARRQV